MLNRKSLIRVFSSTWFKFIVAIGVIGLLVYYNRVDVTALGGLYKTWPWLLTAFGLMFPPFIIVSYRFKIILKNQGFDVGFPQAVRWTMIGSFFDLAMPSSNGGDLIKAGMIAKHVGAGQRTRAVMAVVFDRLLGLLGLFLLAFLVSMIGWELLSSMSARKLVAGVSLLASVGSLIFLRIVGSRRLYHNQLINRLLLKHAIGLRIKQFIASFNCLREEPLSLILALGLSIVNHVFWCASLLCIVRVIGYSVDPIKGFFVFPLAIFSNIFGIAGGFGLGTLGFDILLMQLLNMGNGALIGLVFQSLSALSRLAGLPFYIFSPQDRKCLVHGEDCIQI